MDILVNFFDKYESLLSLSFFILILPLYKLIQSIREHEKNQQKNISTSQKNIELLAEEVTILKDEKKDCKIQMIKFEKLFSKLDKELEELKRSNDLKDKQIELLTDEVNMLKNLVYKTIPAEEVQDHILNKTFERKRHSDEKVKLFKA